MSKGELAFVDWLRKRCSSASPLVKVGIGDDMAWIEPGPRGVLITSDMLLDGVHFDCPRHALGLIGRKSLACSLSDCAAMAVEPLAATVSLALPSGFSMSQAQELIEGMMPLAERYRCAISGGDTNSWDHPLAIDVTMVGRPYPDCRPATRHGAQPGDRLFVTGPLGGSILGRHLTFEPRVEEAHRLAVGLGDRLHAMMDISDGLALDLHRMCEASRVGACLAEALLEQVIHPDARELARRQGGSALDHALSDGEDFELIVCVDGEVQPSDRGVPLLEIGRITDSGMRLVGNDRAERALPIRGYEHFR